MMTRQEAVWHANHVFNLVIERCINAQNLKDAREFDEAKQIVIEALVQEPIIHCEDCKHHGTSNCPMWGNDTTEDYMWCCDGEKTESDGE